jgi:uncharacterized protein (DUF927 family)
MEIFEELESLSDPPILDYFETQNPLLEAALNYVRRGWPVFPCHTPKGHRCSCGKSDCDKIGKHPRYHEQDLEHGLKSAALDEQIIKEWWTRWPDANVGIVTGEKSGLVVLDVDPKNDGHESLEELEKIKGKLPDTVETITGSGGRHILFRHPGRKISNKTGFKPGLDIRGDGGYIVAPPSLHVSGRTYEWELSSHPDDVSLAEIPDWLLKLIEGGGEKTKTCEPEVGKSSDFKIPDGKRNSTLASLAGSMRCKGMSKEAIEAALIAENLSRCNPPLPETEVKKIAESIASYEPGNPGGVTSPINLLFQKSSVKKLDDLEEAKISLENIIDLSSREPKNFLLEVLQNAEYVGSLALVAEQDDIEYQTTLKKMENNGVKVKDIDSLKRAINKKRAEYRGIHLAEPGEQPTLVKLKDVIPGVPVTDNILIPKGWNLSLNEGLVKSSWSKDSGYQQIMVAPTPIIIVGRMFNVGTGNESIKLSWFRDGKWKTRIVERGVIATKRSITSLADLGVPVTDQNAKLLIEFLSEFESQNIGSLPLAQVSNILGWQKNGQGFLWGKTHFRVDGTDLGTIDLDSIPSEYWQKEFITFKGDDEGDQQIADGFVSNGEYELWIQAVNKLFSYPFAISGVYFSLLPPFLEILGADNFTVDWANRSSVGKTTILRVAGSCWGDPDEKHPASVVQSWDATKVWIEKAAAMLNGLPLILDDTKLAGTGKNKEFAAAEISQVLYQIAQGRGRGRGSVNGTRSTGSWRTILLSTGEQSAVDFTGDGGSRARVISFWGLPFEKADESTVSTVQEINLAVKENYGHAGPKVIEFILKNQSEWAVWKSEYQRMRTKFTLMAGSDSVAIRISDNFAFLATVIPIIHAALPELKQDISPMQIIQPLWDAAIRDIKEADRATVALQTVYDWAVANQTSFWGRHQESTGGLRIPVHGWAGAWNSKDWNYIAYIEEKLYEILKNGGFDTEAIIKTWKDRDWLQTDKTGRRKHVRINGPRAYCYCIKKSVLDKILKLKMDDDNDE